MQILEFAHISQTLLATPLLTLKSRDGKSKLFPSCGSVEHCDRRNTSVAQRYNTLKHCAGGGGERDEDGSSVELQGKTSFTTNPLS